METILKLASFYGGKKEKEKEVFQVRYDCTKKFRKYLGE